MASCARLLTVSAVVEEVNIVVNKFNQVDSLSREEVRRIFMGEKSSWPGGKRIIVLMLAPDQAERAVILREVYRMNESDYTKYFLQAAFAAPLEEAPKQLPPSIQLNPLLPPHPTP